MPYIGKDNMRKERDILGCVEGLTTVVLPTPPVWIKLQDIRRLLLLNYALDVPSVLCSCAWDVVHCWDVAVVLDNDSKVKSVIESKLI